MSNTAQELITVESITQYGIRSNGKNYGISTKLSQTGVTPQSFTQGGSYLAQVWTGPQGGKKINSFVPANGQAQVPTPQAVVPMPPTYTTPSLPPTTVSLTQAPGGVAPVAPLAPAASRGASVAKDEDKMSKADWADRNREIAIQAILKSSIESPALGEHVTGKSTPELLTLTRQFIKANLETYQLAVDGKL